MNAPFAIHVKFDLLRVGHCQHAECMAMRGGGRRAIDFPALVGLIEHPQRGLLLYDTGYAHHFDAATRRFPECLYRAVTRVTLPPNEELLVQLESRGIATRDIDTIIVSHFHADHVAGLRDFPNARFIATRAERLRCEKMGRLGRLRRAFLRDLLPADFDARASAAEDLPNVQLPSEWKPFAMARDLLGDASLLGLDLPGHTASQLGIAFCTPEMGSVFMIGDACWKIEGLEQNRKPSRLAYTLFDSAKAYDNTFAALRELNASPHAPAIIPSHCSTTWTRLGGTRRICRV